MTALNTKCKKTVSVNDETEKILDIFRTSRAVSFSLKFRKTKPYTVRGSEPVVYDIPLFKGMIPSWQNHDMKTGVNNTDNE